MERALSLYESGSPATEGIDRKGRKSAFSFVENPWANRTASYLMQIKKLSPAKCTEIFSLASEYMDGEKILEVVDGFGGESSDGFDDPRANIRLSDDE